MDNQTKRYLLEVKTKDKSEVDKLKALMESPEMEKVCVHMWSNSFELTVIVALSGFIGWFVGVLFF